MKREMSRRGFLIGTAGAAGGGLGLGLWRRHCRQGREFQAAMPASTDLSTDELIGRGRLVVAHGADPGDNVRRALEASGAIGKLVSPGTKVVLKPNMAWDLPPRQGANTNPEVVAMVVKMCLAAGAHVTVFDRPMSRDPTGPYKTSGIADAVEAAGGKVHIVDERRFHSVEIPDPLALKTWSFYDHVLFADKVDVLINMPVAKTHSTSGLTLGLKNVFGMVGGERGQLHQDIHKKIADLNQVVNVHLTILDATRVMFRNGPNSPRPRDVDDSARRAQRVVVSTDRVAVDAYAADHLFEKKHAERAKNGSFGFIDYAEQVGLGTATYEIAETV